MCAGLIWSEIKQLWDTGAKAYISDMWNVADFVTNSLYLATIALRLRAYYDVSNNTFTTQPYSGTFYWDLVGMPSILKEIQDVFTHIQHNFNLQRLIGNI